MLQMSILDFLLIAVPEGLVYIFALYVLSKKSIESKKYWLASGIHALMIFAIRLLPISYGVHTILIMTVLILIGINVTKINAISTVRSTILTVVLQFISEGIVAAVIEKIFKKDISKLISNPYIKIVCGVVALLILVAIILIVKRRDEKSVEHGKNGEQLS